MSKKAEQGRYAQLGVSSGKEGVHKATAQLDKGLYERTFCQIHDHIDGFPDLATISHADGAGTKSSLAYVYWRETGDLSVWRGIAQDVIAMNIDDMFCAGLIENRIALTLHINRNSHLVGDGTWVVDELIAGAQQICEDLSAYGIDVRIFGGETADVPDLARTICVDASMTCSISKKNVIDPNIKPGQIIVGLASSGMSLLEKVYNSGIGSNGLTLARHDMLAHYVGARYPESFDGVNNPAELTYGGKYKLTDPGTEGLNIGQMLLSPTRIYARSIRDILQVTKSKNWYDKIGAVIHCTGGGQTKVLKFANPEVPVKIVKDNLFETPKVFELIQEAGTEWKEMFQTFNMGHLIELYIDEMLLPVIQRFAETSHHIDMQIIGRVEAAEDGKTEVVVRHPIDGSIMEFTYSL